MKILDFVLRLIAAIIMLQTLLYKFTGAEESIYIFTTIGMEPWGRFGIGILELIASVLIFIPKWKWVGCLLGIKLMLGALFFHATILGFDVLGDMGYLVILALIVLIACAGSLIISRVEFINNIKIILSKINAQK
jgi:uncharacterized membrane protein YphA (DoxX/SURF4 family)